MADRKRRRSSSDGRNYKALLLDIEGTTTPITFVKDILFPYVREHVKEYLEENWETDQCQQDIESLRQQAEQDKEMDGVVTISKLEDEAVKSVDNMVREKIIAATVSSVLWHMDADRKITALKQLQGHIWKNAYASGEIKGKVYDDVVPALKHWTSAGNTVYIYSSGSVAAQKLLFGFSSHGDLLKYFSGHFDTKIGSKVECESYKKICDVIGEQPADILFITDVVREARAATQAGLQTVISIRDGNACLTDDDIHTYTTVTSFDQLIEDEVKPPKLRTTKNLSNANPDGTEVKKSEGIRKLTDFLC